MLQLANLQILLSLDLPVFNLLYTEKFLDFILRFLFNLVIIIVIARYIYYRVARRKDYYFTYVLISSTVFLLVYLLESVTLQLGFALGLFAIFGILRYRTTTLPIKEMTYLFVIIGVSIINSLSSSTIGLMELLFANLAMILIAWGGETYWLKNYASSKSIVYDNLEFIKPENRELLIKDIKERLGIDVKRVEIDMVDYLSGSAKIKVFYIADPRSDHLDESSKNLEN